MVVFEWPSVRYKWETDFVVAVTADVKISTDFRFPTPAKGEKVALEMRASKEDLGI